ncbi:Rrf2 family transcriptional regulator [Phreatobacter stygius]|uniref:Rrf2 family transcriptional regulator n=1 Tax=Phreatobacter stygius TaxID=1940610 RepID=A0A4D7B143_9HYPH|nr:Rrf2 family transcriptional regulator [Phreatobacter stygius]QCI63206.1 Rrf2 family transcriptional regulator [Phreatobacter stygius]
MRKDNRLSRMLHVLIHMQLRGGSTTSETLALMLNTNPVVVRRVMAGLRQHGYVRSEGGHHGGWTLACELSSLTVLDVHRALGAPEVLAVGLAADHPACPVERAVTLTLGTALRATELALLDRLGHLTVADIAAELVV